MGKVSKAVTHLSPDEIQARMRKTTGYWRIQRWSVIWHATVDPAPAQIIALHTGLAEQTVHNLIAAYNRNGPKAVEGTGKGGRWRAYLSMEEEARFLQAYHVKAEKGLVVTTRDIHRGFEELVGKKVDKSTISRLLKRHGWRGVVPRPSHVEKDLQEQETFKKNFS